MLTTVGWPPERPRLCAGAPARDLAPGRVRGRGCEDRRRHARPSRCRPRVGSPPPSSRSPSRPTCSAAAATPRSRCCRTRRAVPATFTTAACFTADNVPPSVSSTVISKTVPYLPGFIRQGGTYYVYANVTDGGCAPSGIATVRANVSTVTTGSTAVALAAGAFTVGGVAYNYRSASLTANADPHGGCQGVHDHLDRQRSERPDPDGLQRDRRQHPTDRNERPDRERWRTVGRPELGDSMTLTFSEIDRSAERAGRLDRGGARTSSSGSRTAAAATCLTIRNAANTAQLPLGTVNLIGTAYVTVDRDFGATGTASTMVQSGTTITITLGTPRAPRARRPRPGR